MLVTTLVAVACQPMPPSGRYSARVYKTSQLTTETDLVYGTAPGPGGSPVTLKLDLYRPPADTTQLRPVVVLIHGGGFTKGDKIDLDGTARDYAMRGFVAVSINYRLDPGVKPSDAPRYLRAATNGIDDAMEAVRWVRRHAATYRIDPTRIAAVGSSAGGAIALGLAATDDPTPGGPLAAHSPKVRAAVSTGAHLTPGIEAGQVTFQATDAPALMYHFATDSTTGSTAAYARRTCDGFTAAGASCQFVAQPGSGHTVSISGNSPQWGADLGTFLWQKLDLFALTTP